MKNNIYDLHISEIILRMGNISTSGGAYIGITSSLSSNQVNENFNSTESFTSQIYNIPAGYSVAANSHTLVFTSGPPATPSSSNSLTTTSNVILGVVGSTYYATANATLIHATLPPINLNKTFLITAVLPISYGMLTTPIILSTVGFQTIPSTSNNFIIQNTIVGRLTIVLPITNLPVLFLTDQNGIVLNISNFTVTVVGSLKYYVLNYNTQFTGGTNKIFTIHY